MHCEGTRAGTTIMVLVCRLLELRLASIAPGGLLAMIMMSGAASTIVMLGGVLTLDGQP